MDHCRVRSPQARKKIIAHIKDLEDRRTKADGLPTGFKIGKGIKKKTQPWKTLGDQANTEELSDTYELLIKEYGLHELKRLQPATRAGQSLTY